VERTTTTTMTTATTTMGSPAGGLRHREGTWRQTGGRAPAFARRESRQSQGRTYQCADSILRTTRRGDTNHAASRSRPRMHSSSARLSPTLPLSARARTRGPFHFQSSPFSFSDFFFCFFSLFSFLSPSRLAFLSVPPYLSCSTCETCSFQRCCSFCCFSSIFPARCNFAFRAAGDTVSRGISLSLSLPLVMLLRRGSFTSLGGVLRHVKHAGQIPRKRSCCRELIPRFLKDNELRTIYSGGQFAALMFAWDLEI